MPKKQTATFKIWFLVFTLPLLAHTMAYADPIVTPQDTNDLAEMADLTANTFMQQSFTLRFKLLYDQNLPTQIEKQNFRQLTKDTLARLEQIAEDQQKLKTEIENYQGDDWDQKYGSTGLWRKLTRQIHKTQLLKYRIEYWGALSAGSAKPAEKSQLEKLKKDLSLKNNRDDIELVLEMAFLQLKHTPQAVKETLATYPQIEDFLSELVLADLNNRLVQKQDLSQIGPIKAELAAKAAWKNSSDDNKKLLDYLSTQEKFQTPLLLYVCASKFAETSPAKTVDLLIKASNLQKSDQLDIEPQDIAAQAARLAYNLFVNDSNNCQLAIDAFENYSSLTREKTDEELKYLHCTVLFECGQVQKSEQLLEKITNRPAGKFANRARLDLIIRSLKQNNSTGPQQLKELIIQADLQKQYDIKAHALNIYCPLLLDQDDNNSIAEVIDILEENVIKRHPHLAAFKSKAFQKLGNLDNAVDCMLIAASPNNCRYTPDATKLLTEIANQIDSIQADHKNFDQAIASYTKLATFCYDCLGDLKTPLLLAEFSTLTADNTNLLLAENLLDELTKKTDIENPDIIRCRARLLTKQNNFAESAKLWSKVCQIRKNLPSQTDSRPWQWWRAKYYELENLSKTPQPKTLDIIHTIDVLENSFRDIPPLWAKKLNSLKVQLAAGND